MPRITMQATGGLHQAGSTPGIDRRFNERDLRIYPELMELAIDYTRRYGGTFEPVLAAQELLADMGTLPVPVAKMVLNTAYSDASVRFKLTEGSFDNSTMEDATIVEFPPRPEPSHTIYVPPEPEDEEPRTRNYRIRIPARIKARYGMSSFNGKVLHRVDPYSRHYIEWRSSAERTLWDRRDGLPEDMVRDERDLIVYWDCGGHGTSNPMLFHERPDDVPYCRSGCFSWLCPTCVKMVHLDPDARPEDPIGPCPRCGGTP